MARVRDLFDPYILARLVELGGKQAVPERARVCEDAANYITRLESWITTLERFVNVPPEVDLGAFGD